MKLHITVEGRTYEVDVELVEEEETPAETHAPLPPPLPPPAFTPGHTAAFQDDPTVCRSPVMGLVIKVNVEPGQSFEPGALLVVLEAMKMETNIVAPKNLTVKSVLVKPGDPVKLNQILLEFEEESA